ncbi:MAG: MFS transporter [Sphingomonadaceae bacterium]|nr:MAG: MFS transporter [Sphingomonadaceae bacterium]
MEPAIISLIAASITFVGSHFVLSHPLRAALVGLLGEAGFQILYSIVATGALVWMYLAFVAIDAPRPLLPWGFDNAAWFAASLLTLAAMVLLAGSLSLRNPALATPKAELAARNAPVGVFSVTRHPMMWGFALVGVAHILATPTERTVIVALAIILLALVGAHLQDRKKLVLMGEAWAEWQRRTTFRPRLAGIAMIAPGTWLVGIALWFGLSWLHLPLGGVPAGIWRWI